MDGYRVLKPPNLPINPKVKGCSKLKWRAIYTNLPVNTIVRLSHPQSGDSQDQETFLAASADKQTRNYDTECSNHHPSLSTLRSKGLNRSKMKWWAIYTYYIYSLRSWNKTSYAIYWDKFMAFLPQQKSEF